jgi:hypothetical protein
MKKAACFALLIPALLLAAASAPTDAVVAPSPYSAHSAYSKPAGNPTPATDFAVGRVDTVGGTIYDWIVNAVTMRFVANATAYGVHVTWMYSADTTGTQADRNMRYNFYDYSTRAWNYIDPDFMASGTNVFTERSGFGSLDADPTSGVAIIDCHQGTPIHPEVGRDIAPGSGLFEFANGAGSPAEGYLWPPISVGQNSTIHIAPIDDASRDNVYYSQIASWPTYTSPISMPTTPPTFPTQLIAASKVSNKVCLTYCTAVAFPYIGYYQISEDGGATWGGEVEFAYPPAFGGVDTMATYYITSLNPFYDRNDRLHIVVDVMPIWNDTVFAAPIEIWHWCPDNSPEWSRIARAEADPYGTWDVGTNSLLADRPQLGQDDDGNLFAVWEQFDVNNVEPQTNLCRADIWIAKSADNGATWPDRMIAAAAGTNSLRCPSITDMAIEGDPDTVVVLYQIDQVAGFKAGSSPVGPWSFNAMVAQFISADQIGISEQRPSPTPVRLDIAAMPNPVKSQTQISYSLPRTGEVSLVVSDAAGRTVGTLASGYREAGRYRTTWDASDCAAGVYFYTLTGSGTSVTKKLTLVH